MTAALRFFVLIEVLGRAATPLALVVFARLPGRGVAFAKPLGLLLATWLVWMAGSLHVVPNGLGAWIGAVLVLAVAGALAWRRWRPELWTGPPRRWGLWSEGIALVAFAVMALLVAYSPDVWQTEKPMDMAFVNAAGDARTFPPEDPWMAGQDLNYYYLGHLMAAGLVRLSGVAPDVGYNLAVATFFALSAVAAFGLAGALTARVAGGLGGAGLVAPAAPGGGGGAGARGRHGRGGDRRARGGRPAERLRLVRGLAGRQGDDQRVPGVLLHARRPPRARDGDPVLAARARVRAPARARRAAGPAAAGGGDRARGERHRDRDALRDQRLVVPGRRRPVPARRPRPPARGARRPRARPHAGVGAGGARARGHRGAAVPARLRRRRRRSRHGLRAGPLLELGARQRQALRALRLSGRHGLPRAARALAPSVAHRGGGARGRAVRGLAAGGREPGRGRRARRPRMGGRARRVPRARPRGRALRLGADRRRAAVPADPRGRLRQGLLRRRRPLPDEHGLQARLPGVAAAGRRRRGGHRLEHRVARAPPAPRVGDRAARRGPARRRISDRGHLRAQGRLRAGAAPRRPALAVAVRAGRPTRDRVAARPRAARCGGARGGGRRLLGLRARPH